MKKSVLVVLLLAFVFCFEAEKTIYAQSASAAEQLKEIKELYDSGIITGEEYEKLRNDLIQKLDEEYAGSLEESYQIPA
ncbi:MAG: SHOCT domain-containing protein, partial [Candidatus Erginobacter occultus]|nr:SHOCT domain-containing protein [Candidatus Erginobacter occultus]